MKKRILSILLLCCMVLTLLPTAAFAAGEIDEQFTLAPGGTYYFDLSAMGIPGTVNDALPDKTMRYVPFTYAGTVDSYKLTSEMATTEEYAQQSKYAHSLFIVDFAVTHEVSWDNLNAKGLIFGKNYTAGGVSYTLRAPSVGSDSAGSGDSQHGTPQSNEWDRILDKNDGYIKNWSRMHSWGQDISRSSWTTRAFRGYISARYWTASWSESSRPSVGFRPVLEILNPGTLGSDGLKAVTLDLGGGKLGNSFKDIQIIVKKGSEFTAPASDGLTRPDGNADSYFQWLGSDGKLYAPGDSVPADVIKLTAQFDFKEQFTLAPGGVYYFDLSGVSIPGTANGSLPDKTMHYVPFTYAGTVVAYKLTSEMATTEEYAQQNEYAHSLFVADYAVTHAVSWDNLNAEGLIFGKGYATGSVDYTLRAPSGGSGGTGSGALERGTPQSNEWDRILDKDDGYIKNWRNIGSWGQDTLPNTLSNRVIRGQDDLPRTYAGANTTLSFPFLGFRPVLEVLNPGTLGSDGLKAVTLDLGGGKLGGSSDTIQIIVKTGESFTAPASEGLTRPDGNTGSYFEWLGSDGELYEPGDNVPADVTKLTAQFDEQFTLAPGGTYYFDLSGVSIPGTADDALPDKTMHYVPFTYAGTVDAYKLTSAMAATDEYAETNKYAHSLFVADYTVTHTVSWDELNAGRLIFGRDYAAGGVDYILRAPSVGSGRIGSAESQRGTPPSNEWDRILDKNDGYIKNWFGMYSWGQDTLSTSASDRAARGYFPPGGWSSAPASHQDAVAGFRPVLEVLNPGSLGSDGLKAVTLDLGGGKLGDESSIQIIVETGSVFTAPASDGLTRPDGNTGNYFMWRDNDGQLYAPGDYVPADVTKLTAQFNLPEQFTLAPGGTYYFDLSGAGIPGTANDALPDATLHYVPFTYAGMVNAYKLTSAMETTEEYAEKNKYDHSLFVAEYNVTRAVSWTDLNTAGLIFGKDYTSDGVDYTLRAPSVGSASTGAYDLERGTPQSNEWDKILDKGSGYIQNWKEIESWGQDIRENWDASAHRGYMSARYWNCSADTLSQPYQGFRPILEVLGLDTLGDDGLKAVTLDLGSGKLGDESSIQIIVETGSAFTAPASDGLTRPDGNTDNYFKWLGSDGELYEPGDNVSADVSKLTAQFAPSSHSVTITTDTLPDGKVGETYSQTLTANGTAPITWSIDGGLPAGLSLNADTGEISGTPTADGTAKFTVKATNSAGSDTKELSITIAKAAPAEYTITVTTEGGGTASASHAKAVVGTEITLTATPNEGYHFKEWQVMSGNVTIKDDKFTMPDSNVEIKAIFEEDAPPAPTDPAKPSISVRGTYTYNGSAHTATVNGYNPDTMNITGNTATDAGDYTVSVTSQTGKWADGSTDAVTAAWSIGKATQEAPDGLSSVAPTTEGGGDGKITGVTDKMEYRMADESSYTACGGTEIENLSAGNYFVRYAEDNNHFASSDAEVTVGDGEPLADFIITFNGNGGSGSMGPVTVKAGTNYILPACGFTAPADQEFKAWQIGGTEYKVGDSYTVNGDTEIKALWENSVITPTTYTVTVSNDGNGTGTASPSTAAAGTTITLTATPNKGYHFKEWQVISGGVTIKDNKFTMPNDNVEVKAVFEEDVPAPTEFTITMKTDGNGTASASHAKAIVGTEITLTATPNKGYHFKEWQVISGGVTIKNNKFIMPSANVEVKAIFEEDVPASTEFIVTFDGNGGTPSVGSMTTTNRKLTSLPSASRRGSYSFDGWYTEKSGGTKITTATVFSANTTVYAHWTYIGGGGSSGYSYYTIKATAGAGGSISPSGNVSVREGRDQTFTITPDKGYAVANVKIDGKSIGAVKSYTFENVRRTHTIEVIFMKANGNPQTGVFVDVATGSYYEDAVDWAVENGITQGTDDTHFSPDGICTRAQAVTFLWRAAGSPEPETRAMPFADVPAGSYYYDAVLWAVENGITEGTSDTRFSPNATCTRAQIVAFLWRSEKSPAASSRNPFADVKSSAYYADAVLWAVKENITKGTTSTTFSPNADCTRAQIVTFLWRYKK